MKVQLFSYLRHKSLIYSFLAVYMLGFALYWDYKAHSTASKKEKATQSCCAPKKKKCCTDTDCCTHKPKTESCPVLPACPCSKSNAPSPLPYTLLLHEEVIAYQNKKEEKKHLTGKFFEQAFYNSHFQVVALPTLPLPTAGKERLRHLRVWRV